MDNSADALAAAIGCKHCQRSGKAPAACRMQGFQFHLPPLLQQRRYYMNGCSNRMIWGNWDRAALGASSGAAARSGNSGRIGKAWTQAHRRRETMRSGRHERETRRQRTSGERQQAPPDEESRQGNSETRVGRWQRGTPCRQQGRWRGIAGRWCPQPRRPTALLRLRSCSRLHPSGSLSAAPSLPTRGPLPGPPRTRSPQSASAPAAPAPSAAQGIGTAGGGCEAVR